MSISLLNQLESFFKILRKYFSIYYNLEKFQILVKNLSFLLIFYTVLNLINFFRGVPAVVDLAALRDAMKRLGGDPAKINPLCPVDLVIDHSV
jgi:hypothetical protein